MSEGSHWANESAYRALLLQLQQAQLENRVLKAASPAWRYDVATDEYVMTDEMISRGIPMVLTPNGWRVAPEAPSFPLNAIKHSA